MNIHLAGIESTFGWKKVFPTYDNFLISYAYYAKTKNVQVQSNQVDKTFNLFKNKNIILDSGAFSRGVVKGLDFSLQDYISFLQRHGSKYFCYIVLDIALRGVLTKEMISFSKEETQKNLQIMESEGLTPLPVYQRSWDDFSRFEQYLEKYEYICVAGLALGTQGKDILIKFLDKVFELNSKYKRKLHGLGLTNDYFLKLYPFYSVDSTSWLQGTKSNSCYFNNMDGYISLTIDNNSYLKKIIEPGLFDSYGGLNSNYVNRLNHNIVFYKNYQRVLQELWRHRGIDWGEYDKNKHFTN